jgi:aspartate-semialdehyde dehydrogenase
MDEDVPLVVPEINPEDALQALEEGSRHIIANPNCTTIIMAVVLNAVEPLSHIKRVHVATYQSASGAGAQAMQELQEQYNQIARGEQPTVQRFAHQLAYNVIPHIDVFLDNGNTKEEQKMIDETRKILSRPDLRVSATCVRVPVYHGHSESINVEFERPFELSEVFRLLNEKEGIVVRDDPKNNIYPMPIEAAGTDPVYVGRIRRDESVENGLNFWCVADNIRKGAATNAVQILEELLRRGDQ